MNGSELKSLRAAMGVTDMKLEELKEPTTDEEAQALEAISTKIFVLLGRYYDKKEREFKESLYDLPTFGERLRALREHEGLTQTALEERCGVSVDSISRYENGKEPKTKALIAFACCFNVKLDLLLGIRPKERSGNE